jgi:mRNA interferase RelE/StbE
MPFEVVYHPEIKTKDLPGVPKNIQGRIRKAIEDRLLENPVSAGKPLRQSLKGHRKMRVGDYRVIYRVDEDTNNIFILIIGNRKDVYTKIFKRF